MEFGGSEVVINPLRIREDIVHELHYRLLLCFVGRTRLSSEILRDQTSHYISGDENLIEALARTKELAHEMKRALLRGKIDEMGEMLHAGWELKKRFSALITSPWIDEVYEEARKHGALGGKLLGAGGGGHMLFFCPKSGKHELASHLARFDLNVIPFSFDPDGLTVWEVNNGRDPQ
ncbi:MAG TPA: hypothetical protein VKV57_08900 [bacterium]|nr:hypothetical protein [bacterium]